MHAISDVMKEYVDHVDPHTRGVLTGWKRIENRMTHPEIATP